MKTECECVHEDCGRRFVHNGEPTETTCCPSCGRQQKPNPVETENEDDA